MSRDPWSINLICSRVSVEFEVDGKKFNKHTDVIVQLEEEEEQGLLM
jgi:hypothetical protein